MSSIETQSLAVSEVTARAKEVLHAEHGLRLAILYGSSATGKIRADVMPYVSRTLIERQRRFIHG
jgi:predicted nucleotidyltransferase